MVLGAGETLMNKKGKVHANGGVKIENKQEIGKVVSDSQNKIV